MIWILIGAFGVGILTLVSACAIETAVTPQPAVDAQINESDAIQEIASIQDTYFQSISEMNLDLLLTIWDDTDDVSIVSPIR